MAALISGGGVFTGLSGGCGFSSGGGGVFWRWHGFAQNFWRIRWRQIGLGDSERRRRVVDCLAESFFV